MKVLQINNNCGEYTTDGLKLNSIKDITKDDIKNIIELILFNDDIEFDEISEELKINNPVENIIYENILNKVKNLKINKEIIISTTFNNYAELYTKYDLQRFENQE